MISGGTDGIGMSLVRILSAWGAKLAICGRNPQKIEIHKELFAHLPNIFFHCDVKILKVVNYSFKKLCKNFLGLIF